MSRDLPHCTAIICWSKVTECLNVLTWYLEVITKHMFISSQDDGYDSEEERRREAERAKKRIVHARVVSIQSKKGLTILKSAALWSFSVNCAWSCHSGLRHILFRSLKWKYLNTLFKILHDKIGFGNSDIGTRTHCIWFRSPMSEPSRGEKKWI